MRLYDRLLVVTVLFAIVFAGCGSDSKKNGDGGNPDAPVLDAAIPDGPDPDASVSPDGLDSTPALADAQDSTPALADAQDSIPALADAGDSDLVDFDASLSGDAQGIDVVTRSWVSMTPPLASLQTLPGTPSAPAIFQVRYGGGIPTVTISGPHKADFSFTDSCSKLASGDAVETCEVRVVYNPKVAPAANSVATLEVVVRDAFYNATLAGMTVACTPPPILAAATDFGTMVVGSTSTELTFTIANRGSSSTEAIEVSASPHQFVFGTDNCTGKALAVRDQCTFSVRFKPDAGDAGVIQGQLKATLGTGPCSTSFLVVSGAAVPPAKLTVNPKGLDFDPTPTGQESQPQTLTISNIGGASTGALKVDKSGAQFAIKSDTCTGAKLTAAGTSKTCNLTVTYTPATQPSEAVGSITVTDSSGAAADPVTASLHGDPGN